MSGRKKISAHVLVCKHKTCERQGARGALKAFKRALKERDARSRVLVTKVECLDQCGRGPVMAVYPEGVWYGAVGEAGARSLAAHVAGEGAAPVAGCRVLRDLRHAGGGAGGGE